MTTSASCGLVTASKAIQMKTKIDEQEEARRGRLLTEMLFLREAKIASPTSKRLVSYDPPRYATKWGTKTALGLYRSIERIVLDGE